MSVAHPWENFEVEKNSLRLNTVAKLQTIINGWSVHCRVMLTKSGKKQDLIDRMTRQLDQWKEQNSVDKWLKAKAVLDQVRETGQYNRSTTSSTTASPQNYVPANKLPGHIPYPTPAAVSPHVRYDPYGTARKSASTAGTSAGPMKSNIRFRSSPFFRVDQIVSDIIECPESSSASDRKAQTLTFVLTSEQLTKLQTPNSRHQLRLFCTSSSWHTPHSTGFKTEMPCPIEFPPTCEVRVNGIQITSNLKGIKKKPGTAPPADLGSAVRLVSQMPNRVEMVYVNSQQPIQNKKYYMTVILVEGKTVEQLVENLKKGKHKSEEDIRAKMTRDISADDEIVAGLQKMSLKCPLTCLRVNVPCRSIHCPHAQCFDATSWFSMMEQITTWLCPVCDKTLNVDELIVDGYFDHILKSTPDSVEDVIVEADGEWHTSDNLYASEGWRKSHPMMSGSTPSTSKSETPNVGESKSTISPQERKSLPLSQEVIALSDSDDDQVKRELSPSGSARSLTGQVKKAPPKKISTTEVIDLTIDDDESDAERETLASTTNLKRKETNPPTEAAHVWKKARIGTPQTQSQTQAQSTSAPATSSPMLPAPVIAYDTFPTPIQNGVPMLNHSRSLGTPNQVPYPGTSPGSNAWHPRLPLMSPSYESTYPSHIPNMPVRPTPNSQSPHISPPIPPVPTRTPSAGSMPTAQASTNGSYRHYTPASTAPLPLPTPTYFGNPYQQPPQARR